MSGQHQINKQHCTDKVRCDYAHVGLYDVQDRKVWIAKKKWGVVPVRVSHAKLLLGGTQDTSTVTKDRFLCYWYHTPNTGEGHVHGYPIEWDEGHLMVRIDPTGTTPPASSSPTPTPRASKKTSTSNTPGANASTSSTSKPDPVTP